MDLPLSSACKRVLLVAAEEADKRSSKKIRTEHLLLGLLREENCLAELLHERGVRLVSTREELTRSPHDDSATEKFVRERSPLPEDVVELQTRIRSIVGRKAHAANFHYVMYRLTKYIAVYDNNPVNQEGSWTLRQLYIRFPLTKYSALYRIGFQTSRAHCKPRFVSSAC